MHWTDIWRRGCRYSTRPRTCWAWNAAGYYLSSSLMSFHLFTAVAFLCFLIYNLRLKLTYVADNVWLLTQTRLTKIQLWSTFSKHFHSIRVAIFNIKWVYIFLTQWWLLKQLLILLIPNYLMYFCAELSERKDYTIGAEPMTFGFA